MYSNFGPLCGELESRLSVHYGAEPGSVCLAANATLALAALLLEFGAARPGARCLMPSWTFAATAHAVCLAGLHPKFVDCDPLSGQITPEAAALALDTSVAAVVVVSPFGSPVAPAPWEAFSAKYGVGVVFDNAAAFDSATLSSLPGVVSLHATKPVAAGEGGFVLCRDARVIERLRCRTNFGFDAYRVSQITGLNAKMSEYSAAVGLASLDQWQDMRATLRSKARQYKSRLVRPGVSFQQGWGDSWISTSLNLKIADDINLTAAQMSDALARHGIAARQWWGEGCHTQAAFRQFADGDLPKTEAMAAKMIGVPFFVDLQDSDIETVVSTLHKILDQAPQNAGVLQ